MYYLPSSLGRSIYSNDRQKKFAEIEAERERRRILQEMEEEQERLWRLEEIRGLRAEHEKIAAEVRELMLKAGFDPNQPRVPAGNADGGQWTDDPRWINTPRPVFANPKEPRLPNLITPGEVDITVEEAVAAIALIPAARIISFATTAVRFWARQIAVNRRTLRAIKSIEKYFGGVPDRVFPSKKGDIIMMKGDKKIRFDIKGKGKDKEHFHIQVQKQNGKWKNVIQHRHYFKD